MRAGMTELEREVLDAIDADGLLDAARALVAIPSWGGAESPAQERMAELMADGGLDVDMWPIDLEALAGHPAYAAEIEREGALGVVGTLPAGAADGGRSLILNGHVDVVPPGEESLWTRPPFDAVVEDGRLYGRGALDMKGALCAGLFAVRAIRDAGIALRGPIHVESVVGEEDGGLGTLAALERGYRADGAVIMEPTELTVAPAQAGALNFRVRIPGRAAHGAVRAEGVSAIEKLFPVYRAVMDLERERNRRLSGDPLYATSALPFPICVGTIRGGDWASSVPDHLTFEGRYGVAPGEDLDRARRALEEAVAGAAESDAWLTAHPPVVEWWGGQYRPARTPPDHPLVRTLLQAGHHATGRELPMAGMSYGADMGLLVGEGGIPTVLFGPGDIRRAHRPDEWVAIDELVAVARTLALTALRFCGTG